MFAKHTQVSFCVSSSSKSSSKKPSSLSPGETISLMELQSTLLRVPWRLRQTWTDSPFPQTAWRAGVEEPHWAFFVPIIPSHLGSQPATWASAGPHHRVVWSVSLFSSSWRHWTRRQLETIPASPLARFCPLLLAGRMSPSPPSHPLWETLCNPGYSNDSFKQLLADLKT